MSRWWSRVRWASRRWPAVVPLALVPLLGATVTPGAVRVRYDKKLVSDAPSIDTDGELTAADEPRLFAHYELPYRTGAAGERRLARR